MKKKVNVFGKSIPVFVIAIFAIALVSAALVPFLSNTITGSVTVDSPISIKITGQSSDVTIGTNPESYSVSLFGGESYFIETTVTNNLQEDILGYISESVIFSFDGEGITVVYKDVPTGASFEIVGCQADPNDGNTYYYIGDPSNPLRPGNLKGITTVTTDLNLDPRDYNAETKVILVEENRKCSVAAIPLS